MNTRVAVDRCVESGSHICRTQGFRDASIRGLTAGRAPPACQGFLRELFLPLQDESLEVRRAAERNQGGPALTAPQDERQIRTDRRESSRYLTNPTSALSGGSPAATSGRRTRLSIGRPEISRCAPQARARRCPCRREPLRAGDGSAQEGRCECRAPRARRGAGGPTPVLSQARRPPWFAPRSRNDGGRPPRRARSRGR